MTQGALGVSAAQAHGDEIVSWLCNADSFAAFVVDLVETSGTDAYLAGGAVRDYFFRSRPRDIDLVIPNDDAALLSALKCRYPSRVNRHGNHRFFVSERTLDVIRPCCFYRQFATAEQAIAYFDISVNALGVRLGTLDFFDPWGGVADIAARRVRSVTRRWAEADDFECVHLMLRLLRYATRYDLRLSDPQAVLINLHRLDRVDWTRVAVYHDLTKAQATADLSSLVTRGPA